MKSNKELETEFFVLIEEFNTVGLVDLAATYPRQIAYIEMRVLEKACREFAAHEDDRCIRSLLESGFQIFSEPEFLGLTEGEDFPEYTGMHRLHQHWTRQTTPSEKTAALMKYVYENYYEDACRMFVGSEDKCSTIFSTHDLGLVELKAYYADKEKYPEVVDEIDDEIDNGKERFKHCRPHVKYAL